MSVRPYETVSLLINLGRLKFTYRVQTFRSIPLAVRYLVKSEATLYSILERSYVHFKHDDSGIFNCPMTFKLVMMIPDTVRQNVESVSTL